jgi:hypothetical protein
VGEAYLRPHGQLDRHDHDELVHQHTLRLGRVRWLEGVPLSTLGWGVRAI